MAAKPIYKVIFMNQGKVYEIYARHVGHGNLLGFVEVEKLVFDTRAGVVVDPSEERIKDEFHGVARTYLPMHSVLRIDEVDKKGVSKITDAEGGNIAQFPHADLRAEGRRRPGRVGELAAREGFTASHRDWRGVRPARRYKVDAALGWVPID